MESTCLQYWTIKLILSPLGMFGLRSGFAFVATKFIRLKPFTTPLWWRICWGATYLQRYPENKVLFEIQDPSARSLYKPKQCFFDVRYPPFDCAKTDFSGWARGAINSTKSDRIYPRCIGRPVFK